jgi:hypothetical protein
VLDCSQFIFYGLKFHVYLHRKQTRTGESDGVGSFVQLSGLLAKYALASETAKTFCCGVPFLNDAQLL